VYRLRALAEPHGDRRKVATLHHLERRAREGWAEAAVVVNRAAVDSARDAAWAIQP